MKSSIPMKNIYLLFIGIFAFSLGKAQIKAVTSTGREVILYSDGTWKYENEETEEKKEIPTNPIKFEKEKESTFLLKSKKFNIGIYLNPKKWIFKKATENPEAEYELQLKEGDLYAMLIAEKMEVPLETLRTVVIENAKEMAPDVRVIHEEYRIVNGLKVLLMQMNGTLQGIKFSYYGYYFSNANGTLQLTAYTSQNLINSFKSECEKLLNGLVELNNNQ